MLIADEVTAAFWKGPSLDKCSNTTVKVCHYMSHYPKFHHAKYLSNLSRTMHFDRDLLRPWQQYHHRRVFNHRLSKAQQVIDNAFSKMTSRFRVFHRPLVLKPENVDLVIKAAVVLFHSFLRIELGHHIGIRCDHVTIDKNVWTFCFSCQFCSS